MRRTRKSRIRKQRKENLRRKTLPIVSFSLVLTLSGSLQANASTIDDLRELLSRERLDERYSLLEQRNITLEYTKIENHNRVARMFSALKDVDIQTSVEVKREELREKEQTHSETLIADFSAGKSVHSILKTKTGLDNLSYQISKLRENGVQIELKVIQNTWESQYVEMKNVLDEVSRYRDLGDVGTKLKSPVRGKFIITSLYGMRMHPVEFVESMHNGLDLHGDEGDEVVAVWNGRVSAVYITEDGGLTVVIEHGNGLTTKYKHLSNVLVEEGQEVKQYEPIAEVGATGRVTGPHLHFEVILDGESVNPIYFFGANGINALKHYISNAEDEIYNAMQPLISTIKEKPKGFQTTTNGDQMEKEFYIKTGNTVEGGIELRVNPRHELPKPSDTLE